MEINEEEILKELKENILKVVNEGITAKDSKKTLREKLLKIVNKKEKFAPWDKLDDILEVLEKNNKLNLISKLDLSDEEICNFIDKSNDDYLNFMYVDSFLKYKIEDDNKKKYILDRYYGSTGESNIMYISCAID